MPTYKNVALKRVELNGKILEPGDEVATSVYYNENEVGLLMTSEKPFYNPVIVSCQVDEDGAVIKIPEKDVLGNPVAKYGIHFYVEMGEVEIFYNSLENVPPLKLYEGARWNNRFTERRVNQIIVKKGGNDRFILWIEIEKAV